MANDTSIKDLLNVSSKSYGQGVKNTAAFAALRGLNVLGGNAPLPPNVDNQGYVFFTKPELNLSYDNVIGIRKLSYLADSRSDSMGNFIRCLLSPLSPNRPDKNRSEICDDECAFLPISNLLTTLSPLPDVAADTSTSSEGYAKEQIAWIDSKPGSYQVYDLTATFANMEGNPVGTILSTWIEYGQRVYDGTMLPFPINIVENRVDYQTRIYRIILDRNRQFLQNISAAVACFPYIDPVGASTGYATGVHLAVENNTITTSFKCAGAVHNDPILMYEFNELVYTFNRNMHDDKRSSAMVKISGLTEGGLSLLQLLNYRMYPYIDLETMEFNWYANKTDYDDLLEVLKVLTNKTEPNTDPNNPYKFTKIITEDNSGSPAPK